MAEDGAADVDAQVVALGGSDALALAVLAAGLPGARRTVVALDAPGGTVASPPVTDVVVVADVAADVGRWPALVPALRAASRPGARVVLLAPGVAGAVEVGLGAGADAVLATPLSPATLGRLLDDLAPLDGADTAGAARG